MGFPGQQADPAPVRCAVFFRRQRSRWLSNGRSCVTRSSPSAPHSRRQAARRCIADERAGRVAGASAAQEVQPPAPSVEGSRAVAIGAKHIASWPRNSCGNMLLQLSDRFEIRPCRQPLRSTGRHASMCAQHVLIRPIPRRSTCARGTMRKPCRGRRRDAQARARCLTAPRVREMYAA